MFSRIAATSGKTALLAAGSAIGGASGATYLLSNNSEKSAAQCESGEKQPTVMSLLSDISSRVSKIEESMGIASSGAASTSTSASGKKYGGQSELARRQTMASANYGIDIVLGAQWGDEGKGKLVDMLSQVRVFVEKERERTCKIYSRRQAQNLWKSFLGRIEECKEITQACVAWHLKTSHLLGTFIFLLFIMPCM